MWSPIKYWAKVKHQPYVFTPTYIEEGHLIQQPAYSKEPMAQRNEEAIKLLEEAGYNKSESVEIHHSLQY